MQKLTDVPDDWWRTACASLHHPIACVTSGGRFVWVNEAWEKLVGYSCRELKQKTWMQITYDMDVGGDAASAAEIVDGTANKYSLSKRYIHKLGHLVTVEIMVSRFPPRVGEFEAFVVEAFETMATKKDMDDLNSMIRALTLRMDSVDKKGTGDVTDEHDHTTNTSTINIGNSDPRWIAAIVISIVGAVGYLIYVGGWATHGGDAQPPHQHGDSVDLQDT